MEEGLRKKNVQSYFGEQVGSWTDRYEKQDFESVSYQDRMYSALKLLNKYSKKEGLVFDAGCGAGIQSKSLLQENYRVVASDIAFSMAKSARDTNHLDSRFVDAFSCDLERLPLANEAFDAILNLGVIGYSDHPEVILKSLRETLRKNGVLVISMANNKRLLHILSNKLSKYPNAIYRTLKNRFVKPIPATDCVHANFYTANYNYMSGEVFDKTLEAAGFEKIESIGVNFGQLEFMGKRLLSDRADIRLSRIISKVANTPGLNWMNNYCRIYVACYKKK